MGKKAMVYGVGWEVCPDDEAYCDKIYDYYMKLDRQLFEENCDNALRGILDEFDKGCQIVSDL